MKGVIVENQLTIVKEYEFNKPLIHKIDTINENCNWDCDHKYFHTFDHRCVYDINFTNITDNETVDLTISDENMSLYQLN